MTAQYSLFDDEQAAGGGGPYSIDEKRDLDKALGVPPDVFPPPTRQAWRGPSPGMRFLKIGLADRTSIIIETALSMFELSNELRGKAKVTLTLADGRSVEVKSLDVAWLENVYRVRV